MGGSEEGKALLQRFDAHVSDVFLVNPSPTDMQPTGLSETYFIMSFFLVSFGCPAVGFILVLLVKAIGCGSYPSPAKK